MPTYEKSSALDTLQNSYTACSSNEECIGIFLDNCEIVGKAKVCMKAMYSKMIVEKNAESPKSCMYKKRDAYGRYSVNFGSFFVDIINIA